MQRNPLLPPVDVLLALTVGVSALIVLAGMVVAIVAIVRHRRSRS